MSGYEVNDFADEPATEEDYKHQKDAVLYAIEVSESMIAGSPAHTSLLYRSLDAAGESVRQRIFESPTNMTGIMLYGTEKSTSQRYPHIYSIMDLGEPTAKDVKHVLELLREPKRFLEECQPCTSKDDEDSASLANVFYYANEQFLRRSPRFSSRRLLLITNNDNPHAGDENQRNFARTRAKDLVDLGIRIVPTFITSKDHPFDTTKFWDSVNYEPNVEYEEELRTVVADQLDIEKAVLSKHILRKIAYNVIIELGPNIKLGAKGYIMEKKPPMTKNRKLYLKEEKPAFTEQKSQYIKADSTTKLNKEDTRHGYQIGQDGFISFDETEVDGIKKFEDYPVIRILGFKPVSAIEPWMNIGHPYFFYPSEDRYTHSRRAFACLYKVLVRRKQVALTWSVIQNRAAPRLAALYPCAENIGQPGMQLIFLPFVEEIRQFPKPDEYQEGEINGTNEEAIESAKKLHSAIKMSEGYDPENYFNSKLQSFYNHVEALALGESDVGQVWKFESPDEELDQKGGDLSQQLADNSQMYASGN